MNAKLNFKTFTKDIRFYEPFVPKLNICETLAHLANFEAICTRNGNNYLNFLMKVNIGINYIFPFQFWDQQDVKNCCSL
jgi:hypothetical protein